MIYIQTVLSFVLSRKIKNYVNAMTNLDTVLNGEFKLSFLASASTYSVVTFENFYHGQCFIIFTSGRCEWYTVLTSLNKLEI